MTATTHSPAVDRALADIKAAKERAVVAGLSSPAYVEIWDFTAELVIKCGDPAAVFDHILDLIQRDRSEVQA